LVDAGGLSREAADKIRAANSVYIPLKRVFVDQPGMGEKGVGRASRGFADLSNPIKRIKGSGREIINPLDAMVGYAEQVIATADRARVARSLVRLAESTDGLGKWVEKI